MSTFEGQNMRNTTSQQTIQRIIRSWSRTLALEQSSGESIVTQQDLDRVVRVLSSYSVNTRPIDSTNPAQRFPAHSAKKQVDEKGR